MTCTCGGYARPGEPVVFDNSHCPVHGPLFVKPPVSSAALSRHFVRADLTQPNARSWVVDAPPIPTVVPNAAEVRCA